MRGGRRIVMLVRHPEPGRVKTRLAAAIGAEAACAVHDRCIRDVLAAVAASGITWEHHVEPPEKAAAFGRAYAPTNDCLGQVAGDLGRRLDAAFRSAFDRGAREVCAIGSDSPELTAVRLLEAFELLAGHDAVVGPATDGGYYLIGFRREAYRPEVFAGIGWGGPDVCRDTMALLAAAGVRPGCLPPLGDIDVIGDLRRIAATSSTPAAVHLRDWIVRNREVVSHGNP